MRTIEVKLYQFDELSDKAKERALSWWSKSCCGDSFITESVTEDFQVVLHALGFDVKTRRGSTEPEIYWDTNPVGAAFSASWYASAYARSAKKRAALLADRPAGSNRALHDAARDLDALVAQLPECSGVVSANGRHCSISVDFEPDETGDAETNGYRETFADICNDLAFQFAKEIDAEITYQVYGDGALESIRANEYEFTEEGERA